VTIRLDIGHYLPIGDHSEQSLYLQPFSRYWGYVIGHVVANCYRCSNCHQVSISNRFRDNVHQTYCGHDLDLSGSRDVIVHVTIGLAMSHFLLVVLWIQVSISLTVSEVFRPKHYAHRHNAESSLRMHDIT